MKPQHREHLLLQPIKEPQYATDFVEALRVHMGARNDAQLARALTIPKGTISKLRNGGLRVSGAHLIVIYDKTGLSIEKLREMLYKRKFTAPKPPTEPAYLTAKEQIHIRSTDTPFPVPSVVRPNAVIARHERSKKKTDEVMYEEQKIVQIAPNIMRHRLL